MIRASALYMVIVITLVIGIICSSLVAVAYFYREQYQRAFRYDVLQLNLNSGINILIADKDDSYSERKTISLFENGTDSVELQTIAWGIYDICAVRAFAGRDTLSKAFSMANSVDSAKWAAIYLPDEDRPISVSGKTTIKGNVYIPKSGVRQAYVDGKSYDGDKRLIIGKVFNSQKNLPALNPKRIADLRKHFERGVSNNRGAGIDDSLSQSFFDHSAIISTGKEPIILDAIKLSGNIILISDTALTIEGSAQLKGALVFAPYIKVKKGFKGSCQLFARDSIRVESDCIFSYPSALGVLRFNAANISATAAIHIGENTSIAGSVFTYDKNTTRDKQPQINLGKKAKISGQIYTTGLLGLSDGVIINGSVFTGRFLYKSGFTVYENYIINTTINSEKLSRYYLSSDIMPVVTSKKKVLQWVESK